MTEPSPVVMPALLVKDEGPIRVLRISNPARKNALTRDLLAAVVAALPPAPASSSQPIRCVVLCGDEAGGAFSSGYDIGAINDAEKARGLDPIQAPANAIEACPVPVVAAIEGAAFGGGLEVALACHMRVGGRSAKVAMPPARLGLMYSASGLQRFLRATSPSRCQRMFLTGEVVTAADAHAWGLLDALVDEGQALATARAWAQRIADNAPLAVSGLLDGIRRLSRLGGPSVDDLVAMANARTLTVDSEDLAEGVRAFAEKRSPKFTGR